MDTNFFLEVMDHHKQTHILKYFEGLDNNLRRKFLNNLEGMDFELIFDLYKKNRHAVNCSSVEGGDIEEPEIVDLDRVSRESEDVCLSGQEALKNGRIAVMLAAGGQGSRLGYPHPKGMFPVSPVKKKSLFQIFCEKLLALSKAYSVSIPLLVAVNPETHAEIESFFLQNEYFGLKKSGVHFFSQDMLPSITPSGGLLLNGNNSIMANPDGHGGLLKGLYKSGTLEKLRSTNVTEIFYCQVDNPLVNVCDTVFFGYHLREKSEFSLKVVRKVAPGEKVGVFARLGSKPVVIEYIELPEVLKDKTDKEGNLAFWGGSIGIHIISIELIERLNKGTFVLPYHRQVKKIKLPEGERDIWKFETFIFDAVPFSNQAIAVETSRREEFAPLKNQEGYDSHESVAKAMSDLHKSWFRDAGFDIHDGSSVEISPLFATDRRAFLRKVKEEGMNKSIIVKDGIYID